MNIDEIIDKTNSYIRLFENGYCKDCNELCLVDNFPNEDLKKLLYAWQCKYQEEKEKNDLLTKRFKHLIKSKIISSYDEVKNGKYIKDIDKFDTDYISKDKIKEKIKELEKLYDESKGLQGDVNILYHIGYLKELLKEE